jgi:hypothetical protein
VSSAPSPRAMLHADLPWSAPSSFTIVSAQAPRTPSSPSSPCDSWTAEDPQRFKRRAGRTERAVRGIDSDHASPLRYLASHECRHRGARRFRDMDRVRHRVHQLADLAGLMWQNAGAGSSNSFILMPQQSQLSHRHALTPPSRSRHRVQCIISAALRSVSSPSS